jgi:hypothetical protein
MRKSFKVAPGVRVRASSRGISANVGARGASVRVGGARFSGGRAGGARRVSYGGATKASIAAREREAKAAAREADIARVKALESALVSVHAASFPAATRSVEPPIEEVDAEPFRAELEVAAGISDLAKATGGGETRPVVPPAEPVDRYELMREHRKRARVGIPVWRIREQIDAAREADREAEQAADTEASRREEARLEEQSRLDGLWAELLATRSRIEDELGDRIATERARRAAERETRQAQLDEDWGQLQVNDPSVTLVALEEAFADNEAPAAAIDCDGATTTIVMQFTAPESIVPERKPARTPTGKRTLKKRTKTEVNALYLQAMASNILATVKETFAVAPGTETVQLAVIRHETTGKAAGTWAALYVGQFDRRTFAGIKTSNPSRILESAASPS